MALPGLGLIPPPYQFDADGNILPTSLMRRASLTGNVIGRIVRASRAAFDAPVDDEDTAVLAYYGPGPYSVHELIGIVIGYAFDEDGDMSTMCFRFFVGERPCHCHFTRSKSRRGMHLDEEDYDVAVEHIFPLIIVVSATQCRGG